VGLELNQAPGQACSSCSRRSPASAGSGKNFCAQFQAQSDEAVHGGENDPPVADRSKTDPMLFRSISAGVVEATAFGLAQICFGCASLAAQ